MAENGTLRKEGKEGKEEKRLLVNTLASTINPLLKDMQADGSSLQVPDLALRCAQFFHSVSQYCMQYYRNHIKEEDSRKTKMIKKKEKQQKQRNGKLRTGRKREQQQEQSGNAKKPEPPKKPLTAYIIYFQDKKPNFVERYPNLNLSELTKLIAKEWKELSEQEKQVYLDRAADDRKRYEEQMIEFKRLYGKMGARVMEEEEVPEEEAFEAIIKDELRGEFVGDNKVVEIEDSAEIQPEEMQGQEIDLQADEQVEVQAQGEGSSEVVEVRASESQNNEDQSSGSQVVQSVDS